MPNHVVQQGEHATSIARKYKFITFKTIWDDPGNADLKKKRKNPNVLAPGDVLVIPERQDKKASIATTKLHHFTVKVQPLHLKIVVKDWMEQPVANADYSLEVAGSTDKKKTSPTGLIEKDLSAKVDAQLGKLAVAGDTFDIKVGHLDPEDKESGQIARLNNLGYDAGPIEKPDTERFRSAVEEFQCDHKVMKPPTGVCDAKTQGKLVEVHGS